MDEGLEDAPKRRIGLTYVVYTIHQKRKNDRYLKKIILGVGQKIRTSSLP